MSLRSFLQKAEEAGHLVTIQQEVDPYLEMARLISETEDRPLLFQKVNGYPHQVVAGICSTRDYLALDLGVDTRHLLFTLSEALANPVSPQILSTALCQEVVEKNVHLERLPVLTHLPQDPGPYITAAVVVVKDPDHGRNVSFHRLLRTGPSHLVARIVEGRGTDMALAKTKGDLEVAICIGNSAPVLLAAGISPLPEVDEFSIANALQATPLVKCKTVDLEIPAETEIVLEGRITQATAPEGPFLDLTGTMDVVREGRVIEVDCITHRSRPIYQALLPGGLEHKVLMGVPREPTIYAEVSKACRCLNVLLTTGGASWLHAVVQIEKKDASDGWRAIDAAFRGHTSLKHVVVVDDDIDIYDPSDVEWAIATRFQADSDLVVWEGRPGSSLDPSAMHVPGQKTRTTKMGLDATIPWHTPTGELRSPQGRQAFKRITYQE
jgi:2,5-furandicarboxylate decarboxylase 1